MLSSTDMLEGTQATLVGSPELAADRADALLAAAKYGTHSRDTTTKARVPQPVSRASSPLPTRTRTAKRCSCRSRPTDSSDGVCALHLMVTSQAFAKLLGEQVAIHHDLADAIDQFARAAYAMAVPACRKAMADVLYFLGRYKLHAGPPEHTSQTSLVVRATDMQPGDDDLRAKFNTADLNDNGKLEGNEVDNQLADLLEQWKIPEARRRSVLNHASSTSGGFGHSDFVALHKEEKGLGQTRCQSCLSFSRNRTGGLRP